MDYLKIIVSIILAVIGWLIAHHFTSKREVQNKRREIRVSFLIDTYLKLENSIAKPPVHVVIDLESVVANIQLFGTADQILLAKTIANDIAKNGSSDLKPLLNSLRADLRKELQLSDTDEDIQYLRMN